MIPAGLVLAAMAGLWIAYLVPHWLRHRQELLESRTDDRFSERLRVIRVARGHRAVSSAEQRVGVTQVVLHPARGGGRPMDRPHATTDRVSADAARRQAATHAHRAAVRATRVARARRRAALAVVLVLLSAAGWAAVGVVDAALAAGAVPSALLVGVLVLGRRAALAGERQPVGGARTATPSAQLGRRAKRTTVGRAVRPSDAVTEVLARVAESEHSAPLAERLPDADVPDADVPDADVPDADVPDADGWVPVPVPVPAYTLKPAVRRADPAPLVLDERGGIASDATSDTALSTNSDATGAPSADDERAPRTGTLDLDAVLARRRASGE